MSDTLLLNKDAQPVNMIPLSTVSWQDAIRFICLDRVQVLEWYDDWVVKSPSWETRVPAVIIIKDFVRQKLYPRFSKYNVTLRDKFTCQYCEQPVGLQSVTMDHVIPQSRGGKTVWDNIVASCYDCNQKKGNRLIKPVKEPYKPTYYELVAIRKTMPYDIRHPSWVDYLQ